MTGHPILCTPQLHDAMVLPLATVAAGPAL